MQIEWGAQVRVKDLIARFDGNNRRVTSLRAKESWQHTSCPWCPSWFNCLHFESISLDAEGTSDPDSLGRFDKQAFILSVIQRHDVGKLASGLLISAMDDAAKPSLSQHLFDKFRCEQGS